MATIIASGFETYVEAQGALKRLGEAGVNSEYLCEFRVNPAGMHDATPIGGDRDESPGAHKAGGGATKGAAVGGLKGGIEQEAQPDHTVVRPAEAMIAVNASGAGRSHSARG